MTVRGLQRAPEPADRRTYQPVRRVSRAVGRCVRWRPFHRRDVPRYLKAAERLELATKRPGKRYGALGVYGVPVLRELLRLIDFRTGRLEPAISTLQARLRLSRACVVRALAALRRARLVDWVRRLEPTDAPRGVRGPQVRQATNAYEVLPLPAAAAALMAAAPPPEDFEAARAAKAAEIRAMAGVAFDELVAARLRERGRSASSLDGRNPAEHDPQKDRSGAALPRRKL